MLPAQRLEDENLIHAIEELRLEAAAQGTLDLRLRPLPRLAGLGASEDPGTSDVARHDEDGVAEVHRAPAAIRQPPVIEDLEEDIEDFRVRLLDLVEQHHGVGTPPHGLGELSAFLVSDIPGRRADETCHRVPFHVLGHVDPDHGGLLVEEEFRERLRRLRLPDTGGAEEHETPDGTVRVLKSRTTPAHGIRHRRDGVRLVHDAPVQVLLERGETVLLILEHSGHRNPGPARHDFGDLAGPDFLVQK